MRAAPRLALLLFCALLACGCDRLAQTVHPLLEELQPQMELAGARGKAEVDYRKAREALQRGLADGRFRYLSASEQGQLCASVGWASYRLDDFTTSREMFLKATSLDPKEKQNWRLLALVEAHLHHHEAAVQAMLAWLKDRKSLQGVQAEAVVGLLDDAVPGSDADLELMQWLFDHQVESDGADMGDAWRRLALERLRRGETASARAAIAAINTPYALVQVRADRRFDGLYDPAAPAMDAKEAAFRSAARLEARANAAPTDLHLRRLLVGALLDAGLDEAALRAADAALEDAKDPQGYEDRYELPWLQQLRAYALSRQGRQDEALAVMEALARPTPVGPADADQVLGLGRLYCRLGRGADALRAAAEARKLSDYGRMTQAHVRLCGARLQGDAATAEAALAYLAAHHDDARWQHLAGLVRDDQLDAAEHLLVAMLQSETERGDTLLQLQDFRELPPLSPSDADFMQRWQALKERPGVRAAVDAVGRRQAYDFFG